MGVKIITGWAVALLFFSLATAGHAEMIVIANPGFENRTGQTVFNEFTFDDPIGWSRHDPNNIIPLSGVFIGTLEPSGVDFFNSTPPEGSLVGLLFVRDNELGQGEFGYVQTLSALLEANTRYDLSVAVGNIASGTAQSGEFFNLDEFPGYRVELLAGGQVIAQDNNTLAGSIPEAEFRTSLVSVDIGQTHALLGQPLAIRLVNLNVIPDGYDATDSPDLEVDFDDVQLEATLIPEPGACLLLAVGWCGLLVSGGRGRA